MSGLLFWVLIFGLTLVTLIISADFFIRGAERVGLALGIPHFIIGVTLIAIGTSLPELVTSIVAVLSSPDDSKIVLGNVVGSNLTNICLVLGVIGAVSGEIRIQFDVMKVDMPMMLGAAFLLYLCVLNRSFGLTEGIACLVGMGVYLWYVFQLGRKNRETTKAVEGELGDELPAADPFSWRDPLILVVSAIVIYFSAKYNVMSISEISTALEIGKEYIALTAVSLGTSLPELVVSIVAIRAGNGEMAVGNIVGSNIFNVFAVMGIPRLFGEIVVPESLMDFSMPAMLVASCLFFVALLDKVVNRWEGFIFLIIYFVFLANIIGIA
ncbi:MAG: calcium/sodium antiporter [Bacteroidota bacterium]